MTMSASPARVTGEEISVATREVLVLRGIRLSYATIGYNSLEAIASLIAGLLAGSVALTGFGIDSLIEVSASGALTKLGVFDLKPLPIDSSPSAFLLLGHMSRSIAPKRCGFASDQRERSPAL